MLTKKDLVPAIQDQFSNILGIKISKEKAWDLFKASLDIPFDTILANYVAQGSPELVKGETVDSLVLSLAGVGRFEIITASARKSKHDAGYIVDPRARIYLSTAIQNHVYESLGLPSFMTSKQPMDVITDAAPAEELTEPEEEAEENPAVEVTVTPAPAPAPAPAPQPKVEVKETAKAVSEDFFDEL